MSRIDSILVKANDDKQIVTHLQLTFNFYGVLTVEFLVDDGTYLHLVHEERLLIYEHPELMELRDKHGWDIPSLQAFVEGSVSDFGETSPTTTITTHSS